MLALVQLGVRCSPPPAPKKLRGAGSPSPPAASHWVCSGQTMSPQTSASVPRARGLAGAASDAGSAASVLCYLHGLTGDQWSIPWAARTASRSPSCLFTVQSCSLRFRLFPELFHFSAKRLLYLLKGDGFNLPAQLGLWAWVPTGCNTGVRMLPEQDHAGPCRCCRFGQFVAKRPGRAMACPCCPSSNKLTLLPARECCK